VPPGTEFWTGSMARNWKVKTFQTIEADGRLLFASNRGLFVQGEGGWTNELPGANVSRIRKLPSGLYATAEDGLYKKESKGWRRVADGKTYDVAELGRRLIVAGANLSVLALLPEGWTDALLNSISKAEPTSPPPPDSSPLHGDGGAIVGRGGRSVFEPKK
jgi:hypothetical protein